LKIIDFFSLVVQENDAISKSQFALPDDVLRIVAGHLRSVQDRIRVSSVCSHWRKLLYCWSTVKEVHVDGKGPPGLEGEKV